MPKFIRKNLKGIEFVHVTTHGIDNNYIYQTITEKREIKKLILENQEKFKIKVIAYCIMNNHLHLLLNFKDPKDLSGYMHKINTSYAIYYNKNHKRTGYVYKDRFYSQIIKNKGHLINAIIYIHNNPVKAKICSNAGNYKFSSYNDILSEKNNDAIKIFSSKKQYIETHKKNKYNITYSVDFEKITLEEAEQILDIYLQRNKLDKEKLKEQKEKTYEICKKLKEDYKITYRDLEKITGIGRESIRRILIERV